MGGKSGAKLSRTLVLHHLIAIALLATVVAVAACGKKGDPVLPNGETDTYPQDYPQSNAPQTGVFSN